MTMRIHILGVCGTFMAGVFVFSKAFGHGVSGSDQNVYPPMSDQLQALGVNLFSGYAAENLTDNIECVIVGNAMKRGNPEMEVVLNQGFYYISGPQWLFENVLRHRWVLA